MHVCTQRKSGHKNQKRLNIKSAVFKQASVWSFLHLSWLRVSEVSGRQVFAAQDASGRWRGFLVLCSYHGRQTGVGRMRERKNALQL